MGKNRMKDRHDKLAYKMKYGKNGGLIKNTLNIVQGTLNAAAVAGASYGGIQIYEAASQNPEMLGRYAAAGIAATVAAGCLYGLGKLSKATVFKKIPSFVRETASRVGRIVGGVAIPLTLSACLIFGGGGEEAKDIPQTPTHPTGVCEQCGQNYADLLKRLEELGAKVDNFKGCTCQQNQQEDPTEETTKPTEPKPTDPTEDTDVDIEEPTDPTKPKPTEPTESTEPTEPEQTEPTEPEQTEPTQPTQPKDPIDVDQDEHFVDTTGNSTTATGTVKTNTTNHEMGN